MNNKYIAVVSSSISFAFIQDIVEFYDSADKVTKFYKISSDNIDTTFSWFLSSDPLHHCRKSPEEEKEEELFIKKQDKHLGAFL